MDIRKDTEELRGHMAQTFLMGIAYTAYVFVFFTFIILGSAFGEPVLSGIGFGLGFGLFVVVFGWNWMFEWTKKRDKLLKELIRKSKKRKVKK